jgi:hypothetical protein
MSRIEKMEKIASAIVLYNTMTKGRRLLDQPSQMSMGMNRNRQKG